MKYVILSIPLLLLLSGCTVSYNAYFDENTVEENIVTEGLEYETVPVPSHFNDQGSSTDDSIIEGMEYYDISQNNDEKIFSYNFPFDEFYQSTAVNTCLKKITFTRIQDGNYMLNSTDYFSCMDLYPLIDNIKINLTFDPQFYEVISSNADTVQNNTYSWDITRENYQMKGVQVILNYIKVVQDKDEQDSTIQDNSKEEKNNNSILIIFTILSLLIVISIVVIVKTKRL